MLATVVVSYWLWIICNNGSQVHSSNIMYYNHLNTIFFYNLVSPSMWGCWVVLVLEVDVSFELCILQV